MDLGLAVGPLGWFVVGARRLPLWVEGFHPHIYIHIKHIIAKHRNSKAARRMDEQT